MSSVIEMAITGRNPIDSKKSLELVGYLGDTENSSRTFLVRLPGSKIASFMNITSVVQSILDNSLSVTTSAVLVKEGHHWKLTISEIKFIDPTDYNASLVLENYDCPVDLMWCKMVTSENGSKVGLEITFGFNRETHNLILPDMESSEILYSPTGSEFVTFTSKKTDPDPEQYPMKLKKHARPSWDEYFMSIAEMTATRHTCDRLAVGCVLVKDNHIIAQGYNGSISGHEHCDEADHLMVDGGCKRTIHAEMNAILMCAKLGISTKDATAYVTHYPCPDCMKHLNQAGIRKVYYKEFYKHRYENNFHDGMELIQI